MSHRSEDLLARLIDNVREGRDVEDVLREYPERRQELEPLLRVAAGIRPSAGLAPDQLARARVRQRLLSAMDAQPAAEPGGLLGRSSPLRPLTIKRLKRSVGRGARRVRLSPAWQRWSLRPVWAAAAVVVLFLALGSGTAIQAAQDSLPGEPLFALRTAIDDLEVTLAPSEEIRAQIHLRLADREAATMVRAAETGKIEALPELAARYRDNIERAVEAGGTGVQTALAVLVERHRQVLDEAGSRAPTPAATAIARAVAIVEDLALSHVLDQPRPVSVSPTPIPRTTALVPGPAETPRPAQTQRAPTPGPTTARDDDRPTARADRDEDRGRPTSVPVAQPSATVAEPPSPAVTGPTVARRATETPEADESRKPATPGRREHTPEATETAEPDETPKPAAAETPRPAATAVSADTPAPTAAPEKTETAKPERTERPERTAEPKPEADDRRDDERPGRTPEPTRGPDPAPATPEATTRPTETPRAESTPRPNEKPHDQATPRAETPRAEPTPRPTEAPRPEATARRDDHTPRPTAAPEAAPTPKPDEDDKAGDDRGKEPARPQGTSGPGEKDQNPRSGTVNP